MNSHHNKEYNLISFIFGFSSGKVIFQCPDYHLPLKLPHHYDTIVNITVDNPSDMLAVDAITMLTKPLKLPLTQIITQTFRNVF